MRCRARPLAIAAAGLLTLGGLPGLATAQTLKDVSATTLTINEGSSANVTFSLTSQPEESYSVDIFPRSPSLISFNRTTFDIHRNDWNSTQTLTVTASQDADALSGVVRFSISPESGNSVNVYVTVLDDETSSGPAVTAASSGYFSNEGATTQLTGPVDPGTDIYTKVVFNEPVTHTAGDGASARPDIRHKIGTGAGTGTQFDIVANTGTLANGDCWPQDSEGNNTSGDTPSTTYVCRYETANSDSGDFGFIVGSATTNLGSDSPSSAYTHSAKIKIDNTAPTVSSAAYYSDAATSTSLSGTVKKGTEVYTKVTFSEKVTHTAGDGDSARPEIHYTVGSTETQYDIVANTATLAHGDCKPSSAPLATVYVCRYDVNASNSGSLGFEVDTGTTDEAGNALAAAWTPSSTITLEPVPEFTTTIGNKNYNKNYSYSDTLPAASGGDAGTTFTYTLTPTLPTGLSFNASTRTISGTPTADAAEAEYTYTVTETDGDSASLKFKILVTTRFEILPPKAFRITEGTSADITVTLSSQPSGNVTVNLVLVTLDEVTVSGGAIKTLTPQNWNTGITFTLSAPEDDDNQAETDSIDFEATGSGLGSGHIRSTIVTVVDADDTTPPTITSASSGYYSNAAATDTYALTGPVNAGTNIYTKITFSDNLKHDARDGFRETPFIYYKVGTAAEVRYDMLDNSGTLASGDCKPNHATERKVYICRYTVASGDSGDFDFRVGTNTEDLGGQRLASKYTHLTKLVVDNTAPTRSSATVDRNSLVLTYNENLDTGSVPAATSFSLNTGQPSVSSVAISGKTATLTLASNVADDATVTLSYTAPATNKLQDAAGNPAANFSAISVTNNTDTVVPTVTLAPAASATVSGKAKLTLTFSEPVYSDNTGTAFTDTTAAGVVTLKAGSSNAADIAFTASMETTGTDANKVISISPVDSSDSVIDLASGNVYLAISNGFYDAAGNQGAAANVTFTVDATAPAVSTTTDPSVAGKTLTITFDEALDTSKVPDKSAFSVTATGSPTVTAVAVSGSTVTLTLSKPVLASTDDADQVTLDYTAPDSNALQDAIGNKVASFSGEEVDNDTDTTAPTVTVSPADGAVSNASTVTLTFSEPVYSDTANTAFDATSAAALVSNGGFERHRHQLHRGGHHQRRQRQQGHHAHPVDLVRRRGGRGRGGHLLRRRRQRREQQRGVVRSGPHRADREFGEDRRRHPARDHERGPRQRFGARGVAVHADRDRRGHGADGVVANPVFEHGAAEAVRGRDERANGDLGVFGARHQSTQGPRRQPARQHQQPGGDQQHRRRAYGLLLTRGRQGVHQQLGRRRHHVQHPGVQRQVADRIHHGNGGRDRHAEGEQLERRRNHFLRQQCGHGFLEDEDHVHPHDERGGHGPFRGRHQVRIGVERLLQRHRQSGHRGERDLRYRHAAPSVTAAQSGFFGEAATTNTVTGALKPGDDVYMRVVFDEVMRQVAGTGSSRQPALRYWTKAPSDSNYTYGNFKNVASSATLNDGECKPMAAITDYPAGTRFVCRYTVPTGNDGDFGYSVSTDSKDRAGNALAANFTSTKKLTRDGVAPTVSSAAYYSDANASTSLSGTVKGGSDVYTKVTFSENVGHTASTGASARPEINYKIGSGSDVQYDIVANTATLASGECKPTSAAPAKVYLCRYTVGGSDSGTLGFEVDTGTTDVPGNALAAAWTPTNTLTLEPAPVFSTTIADQRFEVGKAITALTLPAATGGDAGTTITYTLSPALPTGLTFSATNRTITGTPSTESAAVEYTYTATETDSDSASLKFKITPYIVLDLIVPATVNITEGAPPPLRRS